ncbi:MAG: hypothetical protein M3004_13855 [Bacteroidota bacterium]|nr:hypothetical protein [Bacteroidota bacterium]
MELEYTNLSQDDVQGINYVKKDYDSEPAKGLIHGLQKDAIQNSVGASTSKKLKNWKVTFELHIIDGKDALSFTDEGTVGLIGEILSQSEIMKRKNEGDLGSEEHISRFRTVFVSGDNVGPGSYGRGKLVFQACSKSYTILCDTLRKSDGKYIAFKRTINNLQLQESQMFIDDEADNFIKKETKGVLKRLESFGTRIIILDLDPNHQLHGLSIKDSFLRSFEDAPDNECELSFDKMIQETWWEIILKYEAKIFLKHKQKQKLVEICDPLNSIINKSDKENGWRVHEKYNIPIEVDGIKYFIKHLRFVVSPKGESLPMNFQTIFTQRKKMKIGGINKGIWPNSQIAKNFCGFLIFDSELDNIVLEPENLTHYGYVNMHPSVLKKIRSEVSTHLNKFHTDLGLGSAGDDGALSKTLNDTLKEINQQAKELGLLTSMGLGKKKKNFEIKFIQLNLPHDGSFRVEYEDNIGPVKCKTTNLTKKKFSGKFIASLEQHQDDNLFKKIVFEKDIEILSNEDIEITIPKFSIDKTFYYGKGVFFKVEIQNTNSQNSRLFWLGIDPPEPPDNFPLKLKSFSLSFPREDSRRVEIDESIKDLRINLINSWASRYKINVLLSISRIKYEQKELLRILDVTEIINAGSEKDYLFSEITIAAKIFGYIENAQPKYEFRTCRIELDVISAEAYPEQDIAKGQKMMRSKKVDFFIGLDDPGTSIFKEVKELDDESDPRKSFFEEMESGSYKFIFNSGHAYYKKIKESGCPIEFINLYIKEEMLKAAYNICLLEDVYLGIFEEGSKASQGNQSYSEGFLNESPKHETVKLFNELMGKALQNIN